MNEIERKFLVKNDDWKNKSSHHRFIIQGYLSDIDSDTRTCSIRVRIIDDQFAFLTVKEAKSGTTRLEYEYPIPVVDARTMLKNFCIGYPIQKVRYYVSVTLEEIWEIDVFEEKNQGLIVAEIELENAKQEITIPSWIGEEVTDDKKYYNSFLTDYPYTLWGEK